MMTTKLKKNKANLTKSLKISRTAFDCWLKGKRNASYANAKRIVTALGGNPKDLGQLQVWRDGGDIKQRQKVFEAWQKKE